MSQDDFDIQRALSHPPVDVEGDRVIAHVTARQRHGRTRPRMTLNLTSMIDVTFLLLVYFMVATQFKLGEEVYRLDLPDRSSSAAGDPFELDEEPLRIKVATTGRGGRAYSVHLDGPYRQPETFGQLRVFLERRRIKAGGVGGLFMPDHPIIIEPTSTTRWQHALQAFNAAARAKYTNVTLGKPG